MQACELRITYRKQARDLMRNQKARKELDEKYPSKTFKELVEHKKLKYGLSEEEAYRDILRSCGTTNKEFDKKRGCKDEDIQRPEKLIKNGSLQFQ